jgi:hypothetical protein
MIILYISHLEKPLGGNRYREVSTEESEICLVFGPLKFVDMFRNQLEYSEKQKRELSSWRNLYMGE